MSLTTNFNPNYDFSNQEGFKASISAAVDGWNTYLASIKASDVDPLLQQMADAKTAYFSAHAQLKQKAHEIAQQLADSKLEQFMRDNKVGGSLQTLNLSLNDNRDAYISAVEYQAIKPRY